MVETIPRKDYTVTKNSRVCGRHFRTEDIEWEKSAFDEKAGRIITAPLKNPRLKASVTPQIFPKCPEYLSKDTTLRESLAKKKLRLESEHVSKSVEVKSKLEYDATRKFKNFDELLLCLGAHKCSSFWTKVVKNDILMFLDVHQCSCKLCCDCGYSF